MRPLLYYLLISLGFGCSLIAAKAQPNGNEWLVPGQRYFKLSIARPGTYQLTWTHLRRAGLDPAQLDPRALQLMHRGREQPVTITGEADGRFDPGDILTFSGKGNDGLADSALYRPATAQPHSLYSLFSDTTCYFLTWRPDGRGLRTRPDASDSLRQANSQVILHTDYPAGAVYPQGANLSNGTVLSHYDVGEGWTGPTLAKGKVHTVVLPLQGAVLAGGRLLRLRAWAVGRGADSQRVGWWVNGQRISESVLEGYTTAQLDLPLSANELPDKPTALTVGLEAQTEGARCSLSAVQVTYWQQAGFALPPESAPDLVPVMFRLFEVPRANYVIVTHPYLRKSLTTDPVRAYAAYRASAAGGRYDTLTVTINELFDTFSYGERSPLALRRFARWLGQGTQPRSILLFLIGQSRDPQAVRHQPNASLLDLIPNGGWPGSDVLLVEGLGGQPRDVPGLGVGRLNTAQPQTVFDYLAKVQAYEASQVPQLWRKTFLHLSGGQSTAERTLFRSYLADLGKRAEAPPLGARVLVGAKQTDNPVEPLSIAEPINAGVGLLTLFGHSGLDVTDVDIGFATDDRRAYRNVGRYPFMLVNGCAAGNIFFGRPTFGTDWVNAPGRGAIGFLAHTYNGFPGPMQLFSETFYDVITDPRWQTEPIGRLQQETIRRYLQKSRTEADVANAQQFLLQGDPAIRLFSFDKPDYAFGGQNEWQQDTRSVRVVITNAGRAEAGRLNIRVRQHSPAGQLLAEQHVVVPAPMAADTLTLPLSAAFRMGNENILLLRLNPAEELSEYDYENNTLVLGGMSTASLPFPVDQVPPRLEVTFEGKVLEQNEFVRARPRISLRVFDDNPRLLRQDTTDLLLYLHRPDAPPGVVERLWWRQNPTRTEEEGLAFRIDYQPEAPWSDGTYQLEAYASDLSGNRAAPYRIGFRVAQEPAVTSAGAIPNPFGGSFNEAKTRLFCTLTGADPPATISLRFLNGLGQVVRSLTLPGRIGTTEWIWDGTDNNGRALPGGLYFYIFTFAGSPRLEKGPAPVGRVLLFR